jgi:dTDP-glucose 4,6-dehydratase
MNEIIVGGTRRVLEFARAQKSAPRFLNISSGAVYGVQPPSVEKVPEIYEPAESEIPPSAYARGKRAAEQLCREATAGGLPVITARCFAFGGPYLPLDQQYALGNFIRDARGGGPIKIAGDGTPMRSYLYAADLVVWLWTILALGKAGSIYNVGSDEAFSIEQVARTVAKEYGCSVEIAKAPTAGKLPARYVPATDRARQELGLDHWISLSEIIRRTEKFLSLEN